jgi:hypothetical protein
LNENISDENISEIDISNENISNIDISKVNFSSIYHRRTVSIFLVFLRTTISYAIGGILNPSFSWLVVEWQ